MGFENKRVLIVCLENDPVSLDVANYYVAAKGLTLAAFLFFPLSVFNDGINLYNNLITPVGQYCINNNIEYVFCSANVPYKTLTTNYTLLGLPDRQLSHISTASLLGAAKYQVLNGAEFKQSLDNLAINDGYFKTLSLATSNFLPFGRIGIPSYEFTADVQESIEQIAKIIAWQKIAPRNKICFFDLNNTTAAITSSQAERARLAALDNGLSIQWANGNYAGPESNIDRLAVRNGSQNLSAWAFMTHGLWGNVSSFPAPSYAANVAIQPGAWGLERLSFGMNFGAWFLSNGGAAFVGSAIEPWDISLPETQAFFQAALLGLPICEAMIIGGARGNWAIDCWGDPLYQPFNDINNVIITTG